jgi:hypothetical protein
LGGKDFQAMQAGIIPPKGLPGEDVKRKELPVGG